MTLLALLFALAQGGPSSTPVQNVVTYTVSPDGGGLTWYVDVRGNDSNTCRAPFTDGGRNGPCRQPQAAVNKIPKMLRHRVTVSIDAGAYNGFLVNGFSYDYGAQQQNGGLLFDGVLADSVLASGPATGTATTGSAGSGTTFGTLNLPDAGWTVNDLTGRFITTATPTNAGFVVSSNTSDTITVVGTWSAPTASTTFTIQDPALEWVGPPNMTEPGTATGNPLPSRAVIFVAGNSLDWNRTALTFRNMRIAPDAGVAIEIADRSGVQFVNMQLRPSSSTSAALFFNTISANGGSLTINKCDLAPPNNTNSTFSPGGGQISITNSLIRHFIGSGNPAFNLNNTAGGSSLLFNVSNNEFRGTAGAVAIAHNFESFQTFSNNRLSCSSGGIGLRLGGVASTFIGPAGGVDGIGAIDISGCATAVQIKGHGVLNFTGALSGSATTTGVEVIGGGTFAYTKTSVTLTAPTEISLDPASIVPVTSTFAGVTANSCISTAAAGYYSRACAR